MGTSDLELMGLYTAMYPAICSVKVLCLCRKASLEYIYACSTRRSKCVMLVEVVIVKEVYLINRSL